MDKICFVKSLKALSVGVLSIVAGTLVGCASQAQPNLFNGKYYMAGDSDCKYMKPFTDSVISCFNSDGVSTGIRNAISMQQYQAQQYQQQMEMQQLNQQLQQFNYQTQQQTQSFQQAPQYVAPQVVPLSQPGGDQIRCVNVGIVTNCRY